MGKKHGKNKNETPDPTLLAVEPTIQYMGDEIDRKKAANMGKKTDGK